MLLTNQYICDIINSILLIQVCRDEYRKIIGVYNWEASWIKTAVYVERELLNEVISHLYTDNRLVMQIAVITGLRIGDILELRIGDLRNNRRLKLVEHKTGKIKYIRIPAALRAEILKTRTYYQEDGYYVFPHRISPQTRHRTRSAVNKDIQRVLHMLGVEPRISPHSARKGYAVELYAKTGNLQAVRDALNHTHIDTTVLYALSDKLQSRGSNEWESA